MHKAIVQLGRTYGAAMSLVRIAGVFLGIFFVSGALCINATRSEASSLLDGWPYWRQVMGTIFLMLPFFYPWSGGSRRPMIWWALFCLLFVDWLWFAYLFSDSLYHFDFTDIREPVQTYLQWFVSGAFFLIVCGQIFVALFYKPIRTPVAQT